MATSDELRKLAAELRAEADRPSTQRMVKAARVLRAATALNILKGKLHGTP